MEFNVLENAALLLLFNKPLKAMASTCRHFLKSLQLFIWLLAMLSFLFLAVPVFAITSTYYPIITRVSMESVSSKVKFKP